MISFAATLQKFKDKGEKSGWTYIEVSARHAAQLKPRTKTSFRVKGKLNNHAIKQVALLPMGEGIFILPVNASMRKGIKKKVGETITVSIEVDNSAFKLSEDFLACLEDEPAAREHFVKLTPGHQRYFSKWIDEAKTIETKTKRITQSVQGLAMGLDFGAMIRYFRDKKE